MISQTEEPERRPPEIPQKKWNHKLHGTKDNFPFKEYKMSQLFYFVQKILLSAFYWLHQATYLTHVLIQYLFLVTFTKFLV